MSKIGQHIIENNIEIEGDEMKAYPSNHNPRTGTMELGMDLRDWFAGQVAAGLVINYGLALEKEDWDRLADASYQLADSLIERGRQ